jgi:hypothetical protein
MLHLVTEETFAYYCAQIELAYRLRRVGVDEGSAPRRVGARFIMLSEESIHASQFVDNISLCMERLSKRSTGRNPRPDNLREIPSKPETRFSTNGAPKQRAPQLKGEKRKKNAPRNSSSSSSVRSAAKLSASHLPTRGANSASTVRQRRKR